MRLNKNSHRQFFTTRAGKTIDKDHWEVISDDDMDLDFLLAREDIEKVTVSNEINEMVTPEKVVEESFKEEVKEVKKTVKKSKKKSSKKKKSE